MSGLVPASGGGTRRAIASSKGSRTPAANRKETRRPIKYVAMILAMYDQLPGAKLGFVIATMPGVEDVPLYPVVVLDLGETMTMLDHDGFHDEPRPHHQERHRHLGYEFQCRAETRDSLQTVIRPPDTDQERETARAYLERNPRLQVLMAEARALLAAAQRSVEEAERQSALGSARGAVETR